MLKHTTTGGLELKRWSNWLRMEGKVEGEKGKKNGGEPVDFIITPNTHEIRNGHGLGWALQQQQAGMVGGGIEKKIV